MRNDKLKRFFILVLLLVLTSSLPARAQNGDKKGEVQIARVPKEKIPPAPPLTPEQALKSFKLPPGFHIELVASEPMIESPVAMAFDPNGRLWVVEMRGYMRTPDAAGEREPTGRVSILEDTDGDGRMDKHTVFLDGLVMPRAIAFVGDGVLIGEPPHLWHCRDQDADGKCDEKIEVASDYGSPLNVEHTANGLVRNIDNWTYNLYHTHRYRYANGKWERRAAPNNVQWGLAQDDFGRLFYTSNSDWLRGDLVPQQYATRPGLKVPGLSVRIINDQTVWPARVNPGVNRGYQPKTLRDDGTLATCTAACGTSIYRGDLFPPEFSGNAFIGEPSGNLVRRAVLTEKDGVVTGRNAHEQTEFLTSQDERFRPINTYTGPDGALYIVDLYHGILQHRIYLTSYLRQQSLDRGLEKPVNMGRIYRVVPDEKKPGPKPQLTKAAGTELVQQLANPNGWWRDTAQRLLVERGDAGVVPALQKLAATGGTPLARLHALWTLEGMGKLNAATVTAAVDDAHPKVRVAAVRLSESFLRVITPDAAALRGKVLALAKDAPAEVQAQLAFTLGVIAQDDAGRAALAALKTSPAKLVADAAAFTVASHEPVKISTPAVAAVPLTAAEQKRFDAGRSVFEATCVACHQPHGLGQDGLAPPLAGSEWVSGSEQRLVRIVLQGVRGPITVKKQTYELDMPSLGVLDDEQIAGVLTYVRREWGHGFTPVDAATVKKIREATAKREDAWSQPELLKIP